MQTMWTYRTKLVTQWLYYYEEYNEKDSGSGSKKTLTPTKSTTKGFKRQGGEIKATTTTTETPQQGSGILPHLEEDPLMEWNEEDDQGSGTMSTTTMTTISSTTTSSKWSAHPTGIAKVTKVQRKRNLSTAKVTLNNVSSSPPTPKGEPPLLIVPSSSSEATRTKDKNEGNADAIGVAADLLYMVQRASAMLTDVREKILQTLTEVIGEKSAKSSSSCSPCEERVEVKCCPETSSASWKWQA